MNSKLCAGSNELWEFWINKRFFHTVNCSVSFSQDWSWFQSAVAQSDSTEKRHGGESWSRDILWVWASWRPHPRGKPSADVSAARQPGNRFHKRSQISIQGQSWLVGSKFIALLHVSTYLLNRKSTFTTQVYLFASYIVEVVPRWHQKKLQK